jgi:hypothetical protein
VKRRCCTEIRGRCTGEANDLPSCTYIRSVHTLDPGPSSVGEGFHLHRRGSNGEWGHYFKRGIAAVWGEEKERGKEELESEVMIEVSSMQKCQIGKRTRISQWRKKACVPNMPGNRQKAFGSRYGVRFPGIWGLQDSRSPP